MTEAHVYRRGHRFTDKMPAVTEAEFMRTVIDYAHLCHWRVAHFRPARTAHGWRTPVMADGKGFPDLVMLRDNEQVVAELKAEGGKPSIEQQEWHDAFKLVRHHQTHLWLPKDWDTIERVLR